MKRALCACLAALLALPALGAEPNYAERPDVQAFIGDLVKRYGFARQELTQLFSKVRRAEPVLDAIKPQPPKTRSWADFRANFLTDARIVAGVEFWQRNRETLERAQQEFGVPPEFVVGIIGVETYYGRHTGRWRVVDALTTLAFDYPPRGPYFRNELEQYLLLSRDAGRSALALKGSYAGAIGIPQFMPSSTRRYAVDFDGNGTIDIAASAPDAIGSVANFLKEHGWTPDGEVLREAQVHGEAWRDFADGTVDPKHALAELRAAGVEFSAGPQDEATRAALIELENPDRPSEFRVAFHNFWVLTRYNRSSLYASAVYDLAQAVKQRQEPGK